MRRLLAYVRHWLHASSRYGVHSPFVFAFYVSVLHGNSTQEGARIEALRRQLTHSKRELDIVDFGAGSGGQLQAHRRIALAEVAHKAARGRREGELLYRICRYYQPGICLELGTNLGISTLYQLAGLPATSRLTTLEGAPALSELARQHVQHAGYTADFRMGEFEVLLDELLAPGTYRPDYVFIDGNHRFEATLTYFRRLLPHMSDGGIMVFDDINWSPGMRRAWDEICAHSDVSVSIDLFVMGICFIRRNQAKEHFCFRFRHF